MKNFWARKTSTTTCSSSLVHVYGYSCWLLTYILQFHWPLLLPVPMNQFKFKWVLKLQTIVKQILHVPLSLSRCPYLMFEWNQELLFVICVTGVHEVEVGGREEGGSLAEGLRTLDLKSRFYGQSLHSGTLLNFFFLVSPELTSPLNNYDMDRFAQH